MNLPKMVFASLCSFMSDHLGIFTMILFLCLAVILSWIFSRPKPGKNPFSVTHIRPPPQRLVTDQKARDKVLKQRFKPQKIPENLDAIVIGSGIGGLSTAVMLGRAGQKVLVLEQHDQAGGCCHTFVDKGYEFDTGVHYVGKMLKTEKTGILMDQITEGQVTWAPMDREYDVVALGPSSKAKLYRMKAGTHEDYASNLKTLFPNEVQVIDKFVNVLRECKPIIDMGLVIPKLFPLPLVKILIKTGIFELFFGKYCRMCHISVKDVLDELTDNQELKTVLCYIFGDLGVLPSQLGILDFSQLVNHYIPGAFYPLGGTSEIAFQIIPIIERYGGRVLVDAPVTKILVNEKGRANGVCVHKSSGDVNIYAKKIISDAGVINTYKFLLPQDVAQNTPLHQLVDKVGPSISNIAVFVGMKGSSQELGLKANNTWLYASENSEADVQKYLNMSVVDAAEIDCPLIFISFPSAKDPSWEQKYPGKSVALLITFTQRAWFSDWKEGRVKHRGDTYEHLKLRIGRQMWKQTEDLFPKLKGKMDYMDVGTSLSNQHYLGQPEGETYGLDHAKGCRFLPETSMYLRPESGVPGLYLTGQDILSAGFSGALSAGVLTAGAILHRNLFSDLSKLAKEMNKAHDGKKEQ